jgi:TRAP-type C4-dicarboxylate transport system permease large subunit
MAFQWDPVWFGVLLTMKVALGQFTPPMAVNLMVACRWPTCAWSRPCLGRLAAAVVCRHDSLACCSCPNCACGCRASLGY